MPVVERRPCHGAQCSLRDRGAAYFKNDDLRGFSQTLFPDMNNDWGISMIGLSRVYVAGAPSDRVTSTTCSREGKMVYQRMYPNRSGVEVQVDPTKPIENNLGVCVGEGVQAKITDGIHEPRIASLRIVKKGNDGKSLEPVYAKETYTEYQAIVVFRESVRDSETDVLWDGFVVVGPPTRKT